MKNAADPVIHFRVDGSIPSGNAFWRMHWAKRRQLRDRWHAAVRAQTMIARSHPNARPAREKRRVVFMRVGGRIQDVANLLTSLDKLILDALVRLRWLVDDSPKWCEVEVSQRKRGMGERQGVEVKITECSS